MKPLLFCVFFVLQVIILPFNLMPSIQAQTQGTFGTNILITDSSSPYTNQVEATMTILENGRILVGWKEANTHNGPGRRVGFAYSTNNGTSFSRNTLMERVSENNYQSDPWLISDSDGNAYFVWIEFNNIILNNPPEGIGVAKTEDGGLTWNEPVNAADTSGLFDDKETACVDSNGNIYIIWDALQQNSQGETINWDLRFTKSTDGGQTFTPTKIMEMQPWIGYIHCSPNDTLYISTINSSSTAEDADWDQIQFTRSSDYGDNWSKPAMVPFGQSSVDIITVIDTDSDENVYIAYSAGTQINKNIFIIKSEDGGVSWNTPVQVNDPTSSSTYHRMVEMYIGINNTIHVAWLDTRLGEYNIYYSYSEDGGATFSTDEKITEIGFSLSFERPGDYFCMRQDPISGDMCIVWTDGRSGEDHDIYFARQGLIIPPLPPKWPILVGFSVFILLVITILALLVARRRT